MQAGMIFRATASTNLPEIGIKQGDVFYLAYDDEHPRFHLVKWKHVRWVCSCGKGRCEHKFLVNEFVFAQSQQNCIPDHDPAAYAEGKPRKNH